MFAITAGYHRYFSHRSYATSRLFQFVLAFLAQSTAQKSVLWWAAKHRHHHLHSDTPQDVHSPRHKGFFYSHVGWIFYRQHDLADLVKVADFSSFPELRWLHRFEQLPAVILAALCYLVAGWSGPRGRFCLEHGAAVSRHLLHQFAGACSRPQALRHRRRFPQQLAPGVFHHG
jgi:Fatty-acid desaturase